MALALFTLRYITSWFQPAYLHTHTDISEQAQIRPPDTFRHARHASVMRLYDGVFGLCKLSIAMT